jgi:hypothetical protein
MTYDAHDTIDTMGHTTNTGAGPLLLRGLDAVGWILVDAGSLRIAIRRWSPQKGLY